MNREAVATVTENVIGVTERDHAVNESRTSIEVTAGEDLAPSQLEFLRGGDRMIYSIAGAGSQIERSAMGVARVAHQNDSDNFASLVIDGNLGLCLD